MGEGEGGGGAWRWHGRLNWEVAIGLVKYGPHFPCTTNPGQVGITPFPPSLGQEPRQIAHFHLRTGANNKCSPPHHGGSDVSATVRRVRR